MFFSTKIYIPEQKYLFQYRKMCIQVRKYKFQYRNISSHTEIYIPGPGSRLNNFPDFLRVQIKHFGIFAATAQKSILLKFCPDVAYYVFKCTV